LLISMVLNPSKTGLLSFNLFRFYTSKRCFDFFLPTDLSADRQVTQITQIFCLQNLVNFSHTSEDLPCSSLLKK
jgi:hypothetical protein